MVPSLFARRTQTVLLALLALVFAEGCGIPRRFRAEDRYKHGVVYILPGIEGRSVWNRDLAIGLDEGGVASAIEIFDWTTGLPGGFVFNLTDYARNQRQAQKLADKIVAHRKRYPGSAVHLIGHSGGGGIAPLVIESLPAGRQIDMAILLAPALSPEYDLTTALRRTRFGICSFYSSYDVSFLKVGTSLFGTIDRDAGASAGAVGFRLPPDAPPATRHAYQTRLRQIRWTERLERYGASGTHLGWASRRFAKEYLAPLILRNEGTRVIDRAGGEPAEPPAVEPTGESQ